MNYRYHTARGLRQQGKPFDSFDGQELRSEDFDSDQEFCEAIAAHVFEHLSDDGEEQNDETDEPTSI